MSATRTRNPVFLQGEEDRLKALREFKILDTEPELELDEMTTLASQICETPMALVSLVDEKRQWFKSRIGVDMYETPRENSFCAHAISHHGVFIVEDALSDPRFSNNPLVTGGPKIRFYAAATLTTSNGEALGTLCVMDQVPKKIAPAKSHALKVLAKQIVHHFERRNLETENMRHEKFLTATLGMLPNLVSYIDENLNYTYVNHAYETWFKLNRNDIIGKKIWEIVGEKAYEETKLQIENVMEGKNQFFQTVKSYVINGVVTPRSVEVQYVPDLNLSGKVVGFYSVVSDITRLKNAEKEARMRLQQLEEALFTAEANAKAFHAIFDNAPMGIIELDSDLRYLRVNAAYLDFLGYSEEELKKLTILDVTHPEDQKATLQVAQSFPSQTKFLKRFQKRYVRKDGKVVWGLVTSRSVQFEEKGGSFLFSVIEDITSVKEKELELQAAQGMLLASAKFASLGEMAGGIAHEINNPLSIINGKADLLLRRLESKGLDPENAARDLNSIIKTTERVANIIRGLKLFSRGDQQEPFVEERVSSLVNDTLALCQERFKNASIDLRLPDFGDISVECRPTQITQILTNLLNNSYDAILERSEKWISLNVEASPDEVSIAVTDSGDGIPKEILDKLMSPFFTTKARGKGTGLGLSISKSLAESHHGSLTYDPTCKNTRFILRLPKKKLVYR